MGVIDFWPLRSFDHFDLEFQEKALTSLLYTDLGWLYKGKKRRSTSLLYTDLGWLRDGTCPNMLLFYKYSRNPL